METFPNLARNACFFDADLCSCNGCKTTVGAAATGCVRGSHGPFNRTRQHTHTHNDPKVSACCWLVAVGCNTPVYPLGGAVDLDSLYANPRDGDG